MNEQKRNNEIDTAENRNRLLAQLSSHIGETNAISMTALYEAVFDRAWDDHVNDTRSLRHLITILRDEGVPICSVSSSNGGGYYLAAAGSEMADFLRKTERRAIRILRRNAAMKKTSLPNYLGQLKIEMEGQ
ncbi:MAG: hypothetical protein LLG40_15595 [Deltaproteobacteria bacterium]|nr:hypothetical protein [Deltaproteobacteria bacterium]